MRSNSGVGEHKMRKSMILLGAASSLAACGRSSDKAATNNVTANAAAAQSPKPAYCFFKDSETKDWKAELDKSGNIVVSGKAYRADSRYKAVLAPANVSGSTAEISPTVTVNDTGYGAPGGWWDVSAAIPNSQAVTSVRVTCGSKTLYELPVPRTK
jgi:predicted small lipoprotein YifL